MSPTQYEVRYLVVDFEGRPTGFEYDNAEDAWARAEQDVGWRVKTSDELEWFIRACLDCRSPDELWDFMQNNGPELVEDE